MEALLCALRYIQCTLSQLHQQFNRTFPAVTVFFICRCRMLRRIIKRTVERYGIAATDGFPFIVSLLYFYVGAFQV